MRERERERYMRGHDKTEEETRRYIEIDKITERKTGEERRKEIKPNQNIALLSNETGVQCSGIYGQINPLLITIIVCIKRKGNIWKGES